MYPEESLMCSSVLPVFLERVTFTLVRSPLAFHTYPPVTEVLDLLSQLTWTVKSLLLLSASHWRLSSLLFEVIRLPFLVAIGGRPFSSRRAITRSISTCWRSRPLRIARDTIPIHNSLSCCVESRFISINPSHQPEPSVLPHHGCNLHPRCPSRREQRRRHA